MNVFVRTGSGTESGSIARRFSCRDIASFEGDDDSNSVGRNEFDYAELHRMLEAALEAEAQADQKAVNAVGADSTTTAGAEPSS